MNDNVKEWLRKANDDLKVAELILSADLFDTVCFHSQQAGEKYLKAILYKLNQ
ncbi:HEPN domain-containing protein [Fodinisporobacter ferrooxydans]|uniref:HEPN domain-containing protein n=1 Tax=Fodinisporobacter ferrooxydans TaxID=2901836 RepID=A0ABY4CK61_9BACL|nr:HEPN domain-containing protein [Alicyclobacillaceae bacterium MYW30-H2]